MTDDSARHGRKGGVDSWMLALLLSQLKYRRKVTPLVCHASRDSPSYPPGQGLGVLIKHLMSAEPFPLKTRPANNGIATTKHFCWRLAMSQGHGRRVGLADLIFMRWGIFVFRAVGSLGE